jgi:hypothetical protein
MTARSPISHRGISLGPVPEDTPILWHRVFFHVRTTMRKDGVYEMATITCVNCGSSKFLAGELQLSEEGGFDVVMPCAECKTPNPVLHDNEPEFAQLLLKFFGHTS